MRPFMPSHSGPFCSLCRREWVSEAGERLSGGRSDHRRRLLAVPAAVGLEALGERPAEYCGVEGASSCWRVGKLPADTSTALPGSLRSSSARSPNLAIGL